MNNKTIIEFDFRIIWRIMEISEGVICRGRRPRRITPSSISIILHKILSLIHQLLIIIPYPFTNIANTIADRSYSRSLTGVISGIKRYTKLRIFRISVSVSYAEPPSKLERHISERFCAILWCSVNMYSDRSGSESIGARTGIHWSESKYSGVRLGFSSPNPLSQPLWHVVRRVWTTCSSSVPLL